jgi:hypothetical protein
MKTNVLLVRPKLGTVFPVTRSLPADEFSYGSRSHDGYGVKEIMESWDAIEHPQSARVSGGFSPRHRPRQDYPATNRAAVHVGCVTPREFRDFKKSHEILVTTQENYDSDVENFRIDKIRSMAHGKPSPPSTDLKGCLTYQFLRESIEQGRERQAALHSPHAEVSAPKVSHGVRHTRASREHTLKPSPSPTFAETFKIQRYVDIDRYAIDDKP